MGHAKYQKLKKSELIEELLRLEKLVAPVEAQAPDRAAFQLVKEAIREMDSPQEIEKVLVAARKGLGQLGISFDKCVVYAIEGMGPLDPVQVHNMEVGDEWGQPVDRDEETLRQIWLEREPVHCAASSAGSAPKESRQDFKTGLDVPFSHGVLSLSRRSSEPFAAGDIAQASEMATVLSEGFVRRQDFREKDFWNIRYQHLVETPTFVAMLLDIEGRYIYVSPQIEAYTGHQPEDFFADWAQTGQRLVHADDQQAVEAAFEGAVQGKKMQDIEFRWAAKDGGFLWVSGSFFPSYESADYELLNRPSAIQIVVQDISERKKMEQEMVRIARLGALWEVSAGIGHNLNNILVGVLGPAQLLLRRIEADKDREMLEGIVNSAKRARELVQRLYRAVKGKEDEPMAAVPVREVVMEAIQTAQPKWKDELEARGTAINIKTDLEEDLPPMRGTQVGLHEIMVNLLFNAVDAMPDGGDIFIKVSHQDEWIELEVRDSGTGMDEKTRQRVFEPFFTTKVVVGTGLGLATVYGMVNRWNGQVEVESALGEGTRFRFRFPIWQREAKGGQDKTAKLETKGRSGRILVIDDDAIVRHVLQEILQGQHNVSTAASGPEALEQLEPGLFDAVVVDLGMPEMSGDQVAEAIRKVDPQISRVLMSGWELEEGDPRLAVFDFRLRKPLEDLDLVLGTLDQAVGLGCERRKD